MIPTKNRYVWGNVMRVLVYVWGSGFMAMGTRERATDNNKKGQRQRKGLASENAAPTAFSGMIAGVMCSFCTLWLSIVQVWLFM
jgi:hypothetical protein